MAITPKCDSCKTELTGYGALLFSPPDRQNTVKKFHVCKSCYNGMLKNIKKPR